MKNKKKREIKMYFYNIKIILVLDSIVNVVLFEKKKKKKRRRRKKRRAIHKIIIELANFY